MIACVVGGGGGEGGRRAQKGSGGLYPLFVFVSREGICRE